MTQKSPEYVQKISNIKYFDNVVKISLPRDEWNSTVTWVDSMSRKGSERLSKEWFEDLYGLVMFPILTDVNFSNKECKYDEDITFDIPRSLLRMFVFSIGRVAYDLDVKGVTSIGAQSILVKINEQIKKQIPSEDKWFEIGF